MSIRCASCGLDVLVARSSGCPRCGASLNRTLDPAAKILGELSDVPGDFSIVEGAGAHADGTTSTFFFYSSAGLVGTDAVLVRTTVDARNVPCTPYEVFVLGAIDGKKTIREIRRGSLLRRREMLVTVLTLLEKGLIAVGAAGSIPHQHEVDYGAPDASTADLLAQYVLEKTPPPVPAPAPPPPPVAAHAPPRVPPPPPTPRHLSAPPVLDSKYLVEDVRPPRAVKESESTRRAKRLYEAAVQDEERGELLSAHMNLKLALSFEPRNKAYLEKLEEITRAMRNPPQQPKVASGRIPPEILAAQREGRLADAIRLLEVRVASRPREAECLNMLGVLLAMHSAQYRRAAELLERAVELAPGNTTYEQNLAKVLTRAATAEMSRRETKVVKK